MFKFFCGICSLYTVVTKKIMKAKFNATVGAEVRLNKEIVFQFPA